MLRLLPKHYLSFFSRAFWGLREILLKQKAVITVNWCVMAKQEKPQASIIEVIQEMVRNGESEENIIKSLEQLGIEPDKAKRLLLVGQADTFALLQSEITKIVRNQVEMEKPQLVEYIQYATGKAEDKMTE